GFLFVQVTNQTSGLDIIRKPLTADPKKTTSGSSKPTTTPKAPSPADQEKALWESVKTGKAPLFINANNAATVAYVLRFMKDHEKVKLNLITTGANIYELLDEIKSNKNIQVVLTPSIDRVPYTNDLMNVPQMLAEKDIPFAFSMSMNGSQMRSGQDDPLFPLAMLVRSGLDRETALKSVTLKPAQLMEIEKTHGSLAKNKMANLLIFDGDPLATGNRLEKVILNGKTIHEN
ncbi:MAG: amidohydrolase family protein, partial [Mariniblastus sp.]|nr:amidohydrolase family protein [Mariniblastus sp.]